MKKILLIQILVLFAFNMLAQNAIEPISSFPFGSNSVNDEQNNANIYFYNSATLYNDSDRGSVLRFSAPAKSYARINKNLLKSNSATISFFFFWENANSDSWHQLFDVHDPNTDNSFYFTPQNGWGGFQCSFISDNKEYSLYEAVNGSILSKNKWLHIAMTFDEGLATLYVDGNEVAQKYLTCPLSEFNAEDIYFGGNPNNTNNYYISARLDEIKFFDKALAANQVLALSQETEIPEAEHGSTDWTVSGSPIQVEIDLTDKKQTIQNFGSSDAWNTDRIGKYWPEAKKEKLAELLFSTEKNTDGNPKGIGLSAWRFNIGAGTTEQGDDSRISNEARRSEGFLNSDGTTYDWTKQAGQQWFLRKAAIDYNINHIIGWQNSPPVEFTKNNLGFREYNDTWETILKTEYFDDFARFLGDVVTHFKGEGIEFDYISPLNEPQWGWAPSSYGGTVTQEGTPWNNQNIFDVVTAIDNEFTNRSIETKLFISESADLAYVTGGSGHASNQLYNFWNPNSSLYLNNKSSLANIVSYHSYFKDYDSKLVSLREDLFDATQALAKKPETWQTEYSLLNNGYRYGYPDGYSLSEMETALSLAKVIMSDLNIANTSGWQWWTTFEKGKHGGESRFCLIEAITKNDNSDGTYHLNKLFYTFGNFSHFVRPGMVRLGVNRSDDLTPLQETNNVMLSTFVEEENGKLVVVAVNVTDQAKEISLSFKNGENPNFENAQLYLTNEFSNLLLQDVELSGSNFVVPSHSVVTFISDAELPNSIGEISKENNFKAFYNALEGVIKIEISDESQVNEVQLYSLTGKLINSVQLKAFEKQTSLSTSTLSAGAYLVRVQGTNFVQTKKIMILK